MVTLYGEFIFCSTEARVALVLNTGTDVTPCKYSRSPARTVLSSHLIHPHLIERVLKELEILDTLMLQLSGEFYFFHD